ncbi:DNA cytosine methyltransferase [Parachitinimonas caeni]|uniref:DNA (cytosine-5-)-methyltransferase n=1 Tax=Parachitinimonas caeni TaxID=3031301 RepID=A0ABT7E2C9_9NEIS|nr:DNA cytosine methyltransferase [Parachitinimonas caeni]MDK2126467.1 DNA cytosine methyltransferase [Parachitinimonas caeni]
MIRDQFQLDLHPKLIVDLFAGGGGMSTAIEWALGRSPDIAVNHDDNALSMHRANHPQTEHYIADVFEVCPYDVTQGRPVGLLHLSPDCTHHSQAAGGQPRNKKRRALSWVGYRWAGQVAPDVMTLENVTQILKWGPLIAKRDPATGRVVTLDRIQCPTTGKTINRVAEPGERVPVQQQFLVPDPAHAGRTWNRFIKLLQIKGYRVEWRTLCAADYGAPTTRERLFMVARRDGKPITWPQPTHFKNPTRGQKQWRSAAECIDWSIASKSIFDRQKPLADATLRRIAKGLKRYVLECGDPFIVPIAHFNGSEPTHDIREPMRTVTAYPKGGHLAMAAPSLVPLTHQGCDRVFDIAEPIRTITSANRGEIALASPILIQAGHGEGSPGAQRWSHGHNDIQKPMGTITASGGGQALATAFLAQMNGGFNETPGHDTRRPFSTITNTGSQQQLVTAFMTSYYTDESNRARDANDPLATITTENRIGLVECTLSPEHQAGAESVAAFLMRYYGEGGQWGDLREPMATITTKDRLALVTVTIKGMPYVIVDITLRMLAPAELYRGQGFPIGYRITTGHDGRKFTISQQVHMCGNSVSPPPAMALIRANCMDLAAWTHRELKQRERAAA